jgi:hypothetical protein
MKTTIHLYKKIYGLLNEDDASNYVHIGYGRYKKKGEEDKKGSQTFKKDKTGKFEPIGGESGPDKKSEKPKKAEPKKLSASDLTTSAEKEKSHQSNRTADTAKLKSLMPKGDFSGRPLNTVKSIELQKVATKIDELDKLAKDAKAKGEKAPNYNLCQVSIPGTNLYCGGNKGIPRAEMPQFKGTPELGSPADKLPKDPKSGEVDTEEFFKEMLEKDGIGVSEPQEVPADRLKSTQSELVGTKVAGMSKVLEDPNHPAYGAITAPIYVSNDGYVLDGHHRWAAIVSHNASHADNPISMQVRVINEPIEPLVKRSNKFAEDIGIKAKVADTGAAGGASPTK